MLDTADASSATYTSNDVETAVKDAITGIAAGTLTAGVMQLDRSLDPAGHESPRALALARINSAFETGIRSPFDVAILAHAPADTAGYQKIDEIPFDFERRRLSVVVDAGRVPPQPVELLRVL